MKAKRNFVVPIVFDLLDYHIESPALSWVFAMYTNYCVNNNMVIIAQEDYFKQDVCVLSSNYQYPTEDKEKRERIRKKKEKYSKYSIRNDETLSITNGEKATFKEQVSFMSSENKFYKDIINKKIDLIEKDYKEKVNVILTWYWNPSLAKVAKERGITLISQEISPIRELNTNYRTTLSYFQFYNKYDKDYCKNLYSEFIESQKEENVRIFSRKELLAILLNSKDINLIKELDKPERYELGVSPPVVEDFYFEVYKNTTTKETFQSIDNIFEPKKVSMRYRVPSAKKIGNPLWNFDESKKAIYWIMNCKRILTYVSNIAFDAMLFGKTVYLLSDHMPFSHKAINTLQYKDESVVDTKYLNFIIFGYFTPWDLMLDQEYIDWRLTKPHILEIYKKHQDYIFKSLGLKKIKKITLREILQTTHTLSTDEIKDCLEHSEYMYVKDLGKKILDQDNIIESLNYKIGIQNIEIEQFRSFQKGKIWRFLTRYRKLKKYFRNFFVNIRNDGIVETFKRIFFRIKQIIKYRREARREKDPYKLWLENNRIDRKKRQSIQEEIKGLNYKPLISIVMPVYNVDIRWIKKAIQSIKGQIYTNWELCIADDASTSKNLRKYLKRIGKEKKIKVVFRKKNGHISEASNSALALATGEFVALMDNDDYIYPHALAEVVRVLNDKPKTDFIYSDEDKLDMKGKRIEPFFKPDWSPDLFMSTNYLCHLTVIRKKLVDKVGGFRKGFEGSQDYDLYLRITEETENIEHIPDVLYSWRKIPGSTASEYADKNYAQKTSIKALEEALKRRGLKGEVSSGLFPGSFRVKYDIVGTPLVSIIIPTKDKKEYIERCITSILSKTTYRNYEIIIVDTGTTDKETLDYYDSIEQHEKIQFVYWKERFNYSAVNNFGTKYAKGEYILLLNNDTEVLTPEWIEGMLEHAQRKNTGAVGVKLYYPDNTIQHAGIILGINPGTGKGVAGHAFKFFPREIQGFPVQKDIIRNYSAVTAACLMVSREKYKEVGNLEEGFRIAFNDVDFCLKLQAAGYINVYTPYTELYHHESVSVGAPGSKDRDIKEFGKEIEKMYDKWEYLLLNDPYYNKNLSNKTEDFRIDK